MNGGNTVINFVVYENEETYRDKYFSIIDKFIGKSKLAYEVIEIKEAKEKSKLEKITGSEIYIISAEVLGGLDLAREVRERGDWDAPIIVITTHDDLRNYAYQQELLILGFISKHFNLEKSLLTSLQKAHEIITSRDFIQFQKGNEVYHIPLKEILFVENKKEESFCTIHTKEKIYQTDKSLLQFAGYLTGDPRFMKVHRNYIVNIYNIRSVDFDNLKINFHDDQTILLSRNYKKLLKDNLDIQLV